MTAKHPSEADLALYAGGDLPLAARWRVAWHLRHCPACRREVEGFRQALEGLRETGLDEAGFDWDRLESEMRANIRLGLTAGQLVRRSEANHEAHPADWRALAIVAAAMAVVAVVSWTLHRPASGPPAGGAGAEIALQPTADGLAVQWGQQNSAVFGAGQAPVAAAVSWDGGARAPFVDEETGQVTIYDVAAQ